MPVPVDVDADGHGRGTGHCARRRARAWPSFRPRTSTRPAPRMSLARREQLVEWCEASGAWILESEIDGDYRYTPRPLAPIYTLSRAQRVFYCGSLSKPLAPGLRTNYLVVPGSLMDNLALRPTLVPMLTQLVLARFNAAGHLALHMRRMRTLYARRRSVLLEALRTQAAEYLSTCPRSGRRTARHRHAEARHGRRAPCTALPGRRHQGGPAVDLLCTVSARSGLIIGFASTPEEHIPAAVATLAAVLPPRTGLIVRARIGSTGHRPRTAYALPRHRPATRGMTMRISNRGSVRCWRGSLGLAWRKPRLGAEQNPRTRRSTRCVVTGSRIASHVGMTTPTPVTAVTAEELTALSPSTLISALSQLPQFYGNTNNDVRDRLLQLARLGQPEPARPEHRRQRPHADAAGRTSRRAGQRLRQRRHQHPALGADQARRYGDRRRLGGLRHRRRRRRGEFHPRHQIHRLAGERAGGHHQPQAIATTWQYSAAWGTPLGDRAHLLVSAEYYHADQVDSLRRAATGTRATA